MMTGTLTREAKSVSEELERMFGCHFCREDLDRTLLDYRKCFEALQPVWKANGITGGGHAFDQFLRSHRRTSPDIQKLYDCKCQLDTCLEAAGAELSGLWTAEEYAAAFDSVTIRSDNPGGTIFQTTQEWNSNIWKTLFTVYRCFPSPEDYMRRIVDHLGAAAFRQDPLRLRILKQMLLHIDFTDTDTDLPEALARYAGADNRKAHLQALKNLDESVFVPPVGYNTSMSPYADLKALLRIYSPVMRIDNPEAENKILAAVLPEHRAGYTVGSGEILVYIHDLIGKHMDAEKVFDTEKRSVEDIRNMIKGEMLTCKNKYDDVLKEHLEGIRKLHSSFDGKEPEDALGYLLKNKDKLQKLKNIAGIPEDIAWDQTKQCQDRYLSLLQEIKPYNRIREILEKRKSKSWLYEEQEQALPYLLSLKREKQPVAFPGSRNLIEAMQTHLAAIGRTVTEDNFVAEMFSILETQEELAKQIAASQEQLAAFHEAAGAYLTACRDTMERYYNAKKMLSQAPDADHVSPNQQYHNMNGSWEYSEQSLPDLLKYCDYLASGGNAELDVSFAKKALYLFAFAFDMTYYLPGSVEYDPNRDLEKLLFRDFYADNLIHFMEKKDHGYRNEPSGVGINTKNYRECLYVYYINRKNIKIRERYRHACRMLKKIQDLEDQVLPDTTADFDDTETYKTEYLPALLAQKNDEAVLRFLLSHYTIRRENISISTFRLQEESESAYDAFTKIMDRIFMTQKNTLGLSKAGALQLMDRQEAEKTLDTVYKQVLNPPERKPEEVSDKKPEEKDTDQEEKEIQLTPAALITPWLSVGELMAALDRKTLRAQMEEELRGDGEEAAALRKMIFGKKVRSAKQVEELIRSGRIDEYLEPKMDAFIHLVYTVLQRLDRKRLKDVTPKSVTRTKIIAAYFHYYCQNNLGTQKSLSDVHEYFTALIDREYLIPAGLQPISVKNIFDMLTLVFIYGYINYAIA